MKAAACTCGNQSPRFEPFHDRACSPGYLGRPSDTASYRVRCPCGRQTARYSDPELATKRWNTAMTKIDPTRNYRFVEDSYIVDPGEPEGPGR